MRRAWPTAERAAAAVALLLVGAPRDASVRIRFEPRDLWVGLYWDREDIASGAGLFGTEWSFYLCLIPALPIALRFSTGGRR